MFQQGSVIDERYRVESLCSAAGGMGTILFVHDIHDPGTKLVLKYCTHPAPEIRERFRREVRVMAQFNGSSFVAPIIYANLNQSPPFFVMPYFEHGDITRHLAGLRNDLSMMERYFIRMIDCIAELHKKNVFHRDIKPQNFLIGQNTFVVSDLGLCTEQDSLTAFTQTHERAGTPGFMPPEFAQGGFKNAGALSDIYMLGSSFTYMLSGAVTPQAAAEDISTPLLVVLERACHHDPASRYQSLEIFRQRLTIAFDSVLNRVSNSGGVLHYRDAIINTFTQYNYFNPDDLSNFLHELSLLNIDSQDQVCSEIQTEFFAALATQPTPADMLSNFLRFYLGMATRIDKGWSFAEVIAKNMKILFKSPLINPREKAEALRCAIVHAVKQHRFAAFEICKELIASIHDSELSQRVVDVLIDHRAPFMKDIDILACKSGTIRRLVESFKAS